MIPIICAGWILGISFIGQQFSYIPQLHRFSAVMLISLVVLLILSYYRVHVRWLRVIGVFIAFLMTFCLGHNYANLQLQDRLKYRVMESSEKEIIVFVEQLNALKQERIQQPIQVLSQHEKPVIWQSSIKKEQNKTLEIGQYYRLTGKVMPVHSYATDGVFDIEKWYIENNWMANYQIFSIQALTEQEVKALGYVKAVREHQTFIAQFKRWIEKQRLNIREFILKQPISHKGLTLALLTGDESLLDPKIEEQFQRFGMSHLLAISGPHVLIFAAMFCWLLNKVISRLFPQLYLKFPKHYLLVLPFLSCVFLYCSYVGFEIPAMRTLLVTLLASIWILCKYQIRPLVLLSVSASILLLFDPFSILSAAFWLSYGACFVLLRIYQTIHNYNFEHQNIVQKNMITFKLLIESQWKIFIALFPLMVIFFKQIAWITPLSNLFAIPLIGLVIVPLDVLAGLSYFICSPISSLIFQINQICISFLLVLVNFLDRIFSPQLIPVAMKWQLILCVIMALIIVFLPRGVVPKAWAGICLVPLFFINNDQPFELTVLDVGQGQSIFIRSENRTMMVDTAGYYDEEKFSVGKQIIQPFLSVNGVKKIDDLVLTHLDQDHSGAFEYLKEHVQFKRVYSSEKLLVSEHSNFDYCYQGQVLQLNPNIQIEILSPKKDALSYAKFDKNEHSCVLYVQVKNASPYKDFLLMGDAGWETEFRLLQEYPNLSVDVLLLGHHGSQHSSSYDFLKAIKPKVAIASAGINNRYGHPSQIVKERLKELNISMLSTIEDGSIQFKQYKNGKVKIISSRKAKAWWTRRDSAV